MVVTQTVDRALMNQLDSRRDAATLPVVHPLLESGPLGDTEQRGECLIAASRLDQFSRFAWGHGARE